MLPIGEAQLGTSWAHSTSLSLVFSVAQREGGPGPAMRGKKGVCSGPELPLALRASAGLCGSELPLPV
jgi:hypothetical protein